MNVDDIIWWDWQYATWVLVCYINDGLCYFMNDNMCYLSDSMIYECTLFKWQCVIWMILSVIWMTVCYMNDSMYECSDSDSKLNVWNMSFMNNIMCYLSHDRLYE